VTVILCAIYEYSYLLTYFFQRVSKPVPFSSSQSLPDELSNHVAALKECFYCRVYVSGCF